MNGKNPENCFEIFTPGRLLSAEEVASILDVKPSTVFEWALKGKIPSLKLTEGKKGIVRFNSNRLNEWLEEKEREPMNGDIVMRNIYTTKKLRANKNVKKDFESFIARL
jgi:excisionase family DNA binding protein